MHAISEIIDYPRVTAQRSIVLSAGRVRTSLETARPARRAEGEEGLSRSCEDFCHEQSQGGRKSEGGRDKAREIRRGTAGWSPTENEFGFTFGRAFAGHATVLLRTCTRIDACTAWPTCKRVHVFMVLRPFGRRRRACTVPWVYTSLCTVRRVTRFGFDGLYAAIHRGGSSVRQANFAEAAFSQITPRDSVSPGRLD